MLSDDLIYLRKLEETDLDQTWNWIYEPEIYNAIGFQVPISKTEQRRWFDDMEKNRSKIVFAICFKENSEHIGNVSIDLIDFRHRNARISIFLADHDKRGCGFGTRAIKLLITYAFDYLNLHRIYCKANAGEIMVLNFYKKVGFKEEGKLREHEYVVGKYTDKILLGLLKNERK